jgi:hypothetical protein
LYDEVTILVMTRQSRKALFALSAISDPEVEKAACRKNID